MYKVSITSKFDTHKKKHQQQPQHQYKLSGRKTSATMHENQPSVVIF